MRLGLGIALVVFGIAVGCQPNAAPRATPPAAASPASASVTELKPAEVNLVIGDAMALAAIIDKHKGDVVLVDFWATWCGPCVAGFPHTVELSKKYKDQGLATIAVSFDSLDSEAAVREFLGKNGANFEQLLSKYDGVNQEAAVDFDVGPIPHYRLYDRQGKLRFKWEGKSDEIEAKIQELLAEKP